MWLRAAHGTRCSNSTASLGTLLRHVLFCTSTAMCCSPQPSLLIPPGNCCYHQTSWAALGFSCSPVPDPRGSMVLPGPAALEYQGPGPSQAPIFSSRSPTEDPSQAPEDSPSETRTRGDTNGSPLPAETLGFCFPPPSTHPRATRAGGLLRHVLVQIWGGDVNICDAHACKDFLGTVAWEMCICRTQHRAGALVKPENLGSLDSEAKAKPFTPLWPAVGTQSERKISHSQQNHPQVLLKPAQEILQKVEAFH
nr:vacuolar amino acid transporter 3-like [Anser cygnoides]